MKQTKILLTVFACAFYCNAVQAATIDSNTVFYCKTTKGKQIKVNKDKSTVTYSFGKNLSKPEIVLKKKLSEIEIDRSPYKDGSVMQIVIPNNGFLYIITSGYTSIGKFSYLTVSKNGKDLAELECQDKTVHTGL